MPGERGGGVWPVVGRWILVALHVVLVVGVALIVLLAGAQFAGVRLPVGGLPRGVELVLFVFMGVAPAVTVLWGVFLLVLFRVLRRSGRPVTRWRALCLGYQLCVPWYGIRVYDRLVCELRNEPCE